MPNKEFVVKNGIIVANSSTTPMVANTTGVYHTGTVNAASHTVGSSFTANTTGVYHTGTVNAASHTVGTSFTANTTRVAIGTSVGLQANGSIGSSSQVLTSNGTTVYWSNPLKVYNVSNTQIYP